MVTTKLGVDHERYAYQLALDMGTASRAGYVLKKHGWKVFFTWAMELNFNTKFRIVGPWRDRRGGEGDEGRVVWGCEEDGGWGL